MAITPEDFRDALRLFPAGVTIVTIKTTTGVHGLTVSAFASVSPMPPLVTVIIDQRHSAQAMLEEEGVSFAVNILSEEQASLSNRFAWTKDEDRFAEGEWSTAVTGAPVLQNGLAWLDCTLYTKVTAGTHTIYVGEVQASQVCQPEGKPLLYWNREYRQLS